MKVHEERFDRFHADNPHVYELFKRFTADARAVLNHYSARAVFDRIRWFTSIETRSDDPFKISNNHSPYYARLYEQDHPDAIGFFRKHRLTE